MRIENPFHAGEQQVQTLAGESDIAQRTGRAVADSILPGALSFVHQQSFVVLASMSADSSVWASALLGRPGLAVAEPRDVRFDLSQTIRLPHDPLWSNLDSGAHLGTLFIELNTRRRLRINGTATHIDAQELHLAVDESYPNCPKYIQRRSPSGDWHLGEPPIAPTTGQILQSQQMQCIASCDTFFVASAHPDRGLDASHRGGRPGFVRLLDDVTLRIPDYAGNSMFNTLGNFAAFPRAGLLFIDFDASRLLQLTGRPVLRWNLDSSDLTTGGTRRGWDFHIERWIETTLPQLLQWELIDYSPHNPS